ncbi:hypothetical protein ABN262_23455, partial [Citrobacter youngae]|uniref:hypothetical protein n=1 Tax=Citrobacter youngae TaxID=133448 RepID=UPI0032DBD288
DEVTSLKAEWSVNFQRDKAAMTEIILAQKGEVTILKGMYKHQMQQLEEVRKIVDNFCKVQNEEVQKVREENATIYGTCNSLVDLLHDMAKDIKELKGKQEESLCLDREIRVQQKADAYFFTRILDAAKTGGRRVVNQFGQAGSSSTATTQGEGVQSSFKIFANPAGNAFSTFTAPRKPSQPNTPAMTDQERED